MVLIVTTVSERVGVVGRTGLGGGPSVSRGNPRLDELEDAPVTWLRSYRKLLWTDGKLMRQLEP